MSQSLGPNIMPGPWNYKRHIQFCCLATSILLMIDFFSTTEAMCFCLQQRQQIFIRLISLKQKLVANKSAGQNKTYSETNRTADPLTMFFYHDSTIARTKWMPKELLLGCELININNDQEGKILLQDLAKNNTVMETTFQEMLKLMNKCDTIDKLTYTARNTSKSSDLSSLSAGIAPGTKWCGSGSIAKNYSDLGSDANVDRCCRQHDFCPVKINANESKFNLTNNSTYTKSHCSCDDILFSCLMDINTSSSRLVGSIYFNAVKVPCIEGENNQYQFRAAKPFKKHST